jgi:nucleotide sugar dehydrogenase
LEEKQSKLFFQNIENIKESIQNNKIQVCIVGIGRIGLPTALSFANSGLPTIGVDINSTLIETIKSGIYPLKDEPEYDKIFEKVKTKNFHVTTKIEDAFPHSDVILLSLPTPMNQENIPDYSALKSVGKQLSGLISPGTLIIVESTIEPGFIEDELSKIIENSSRNLKAGVDFGIGVCPETANPGEIYVDFTKLPRLVGAIDEKTSEIIFQIYKHVFPVELIKMPNCKTANAVKLTTNVFRDLNIAFVNELSLLFEKLGIDTFTVLDAAQKKYNFQIHYPGPGVGGPCLPVNSYQMINSASKFDSNLLELVKVGRKVNESMSDHVIQLVLDGVKEKNLDIKNCTILILGISYKADVKDIQLSPAESIIKKIQDLGASVKIFDPYFVNELVFDMKTESNLEDALSKSDVAIIITNHKEFYDIDSTMFSSKMKNPIVIDTRNVLSSKISKLGIIYRGIGHV